MSQPIDIPFKKSRRQRRILEKCLFPEDDGPYFGYIEVFESGQVYRALSSGSGKFVEVGSRSSLPTLAFIVQKDRVTKRIVLEIASSNLKQAVSRVIWNCAPSSASLDLDFDDLLRHYDALKNNLQRLRASCPFEDVTIEMRLLVEDLLLERALYDGIGMETLRQRQVLCMSHLQDIHARHISSGLNEIETCFSLGLIPDELDEKYLEALNNRFADLARSGEYTELRNLCEPIVRSGDIELPYNPSLLLEVLENGHLDIFQYLLDLVDRTTASTEISDSQYTDVTFDPLYIAIRLGQVEAVRAFVAENVTFEGYVYDQDTAIQDRIFTPLLAAVYWHQADILRLLLESGPIYYAGLPQATAMALDRGSIDVLQVLLDHQPFSSLHSISPSSLHQQDDDTTRPFTDMSKSISEIANGLSGLGTFISTPPGSFSSTITDDLSANAPIPTPFTVVHPVTSMPTAPVQTEPPEAAHSRRPCSGSAEPPLESANASHSSVRRTCNHKNRRKLGRAFIQRLEGRCNEVKTLCDQHQGSEEYADVSECLASAESAWRSGIDTYRKITRNSAPSTLPEVLRCLLVADALICQMPNDGGDLELEFKNDLGRWRTLLDTSEQVMFDEFVRFVWDVDGIPVLLAPTSAPTEAEMCRFQELIQNLVSLDDLTDQSSARSGTRLKLAQRQMAKRKPRSTPAQGSRRPDVSSAGSLRSTASVLSRFTKDTDSSFGEKLDLSDFIYLDALEADSTAATPSDSQEPASPTNLWKNISPVVVLLLASVAFSVILTAVSAIQSGCEVYRPKRFPQGPPGYARSSAIVENFLCFDADDPCKRDSGVDVSTPRDALLGSWIWEMKTASQASSRYRSLYVGRESLGGSFRPMIPGSIGSPSSSSYAFTDASSPDPARPASIRPRCQLCQKTFSSVSNCNKHMREGCAFRDKGGYRCRNCARVLSTKWYRDQHERTRCRFR